MFSETVVRLIHCDVCILPVKGKRRHNTKRLRKKEKSERESKKNRGKEEREKRKKTRRERERSGAKLTRLHDGSE
jgi:hypothetical protein